jgi:hypothetical protein
VALLLFTYLYFNLFVIFYLSIFSLILTHYVKLSFGVVFRGGITLYHPVVIL